MKAPKTKAVVVLLISFMVGKAKAQVSPAPIEPAPGVIVSSRTVEVIADINSQMVKFSKADYSMPVVKILLPALADVTLLNHRNTREGAPCLAAYEAKSPEDIIQNNPRSERVNLKIELKRWAKEDLESETLPDRSVKQTKICSVTLIETISGTIRGHQFTHERWAALPERHLGDCR
jgi:hypothetical protein